jgi:nucleotide-binding universal stress UspA family protein
MARRPDVMPVACGWATTKELTVKRPILVPLDGSDLAEQALPYAELLAGSSCELILLEVGEDEYDEFRLPERHGDSCAHLETVVGNPAEQILEVAQQLGAGMIVMTTHGRGAIGRWRFGSVADEVMRRATIPVLIIHPRGPQAIGAASIRRLVVPLDGSPLAEAALPIAAALAEELDVPVHLVTVIGATGSMAVELASAAFDGQLFAESIEELRLQAEGLLVRAAERLEDRGITTTWDVCNGPPFIAIGNATREGDVIVMASHGRRGAARWLLGSVAEQLIREGSVPVLLVPTTPGSSSESPAAAAEALAPRPS